MFIAHKNSIVNMTLVSDILLFEETISFFTIPLNNEDNDIGIPCIAEWDYDTVEDASIAYDKLCEYLDVKFI